MSAIHSTWALKQYINALLIANIHICTQNATTNIDDHPNMEDESMEEDMKQEANDVVENEPVEEDGYVELHRAASSKSNVRISVYNV